MLPTVELVGFGYHERALFNTDQLARSLRRSAACPGETIDITAYVESLGRSAE
ncbi:hypothetical protein OH76DRAFT_1485334 [Lentinus brumalis]|uniref:Uncharacterized protein n=1 Tax=Lentinus brumalis TaxID=2498619 RepID=A0A371D299_9APHY|nr:hypothetical protein OH76DRAFT_1485334 [Polyporus brumalis]